LRFNQLVQSKNDGQVMDSRLRGNDEKEKERDCK
jgi:hypothetical protein